MLKVEKMMDIMSTLIPNGALTNQAEFAFLGGLWLMCLAMWFIIAILIMVWVYKDAESRGMSGVLWLIIVFFLSWIGLIIYLVVRKPKMVHPGMVQYGAMPVPPPGYGQAPPPGYAQAPPPGYGQAPSPAYGQPAQGYQPPPAPPAMPTNCRYCGAQVPPGSAVCPRCGGRL